MKDFYEKENYTFEDIESLINNDVEESIYLDFKDAKSLDKSDTKKKEISKDVASFANSDGGIIIYGIKEENHKASSVSFIDGNEYTKEWLEQIINSSIQRRIQNLLVIPIRKDDNISQSIYIVKIPKSFDAPHINKDKRFYKRFNFESVPMEEYEIRQSYGQKIKSELLIDRFIMNQIDKDDYDDIKFLCEVDISNAGDVVDMNYKINVYFINLKGNARVNWDKTYSYDYTRLKSGRLKLSAYNTTPIYSNETVTAARFELLIQKKDYDTAFEDVSFEIKLFYSNGTDEMIVGKDFFLGLSKG